jgi:ornithine cyclodeaminase/alanine dehydrogenase-like protein (mu-crystallin family)
MSGDLPELYDGAAVERFLDPGALLDRLAEAFVDLSRGRVVAPRRIQLDAGKGFSLSMPAYRPGGPFMVKIVNVFEENRSLGLPSHQAVVCMFDEDTGRCTAVLDGPRSRRPGQAAATLSARLLAREEATVLAIVGAGVQAAAHLKCCPSCAT